MLQQQYGGNQWSNGGGYDNRGPPRGAGGAGGYQRQGSYNQGGGYGQANRGRRYAVGSTRARLTIGV